MRTAFFFASFSWLIMVHAQPLEGPIEVGITEWQPVSPGKWRVSTKRFGPRDGRSSSGGSAGVGVSACPYPSVMFLRSYASVKLGEAGCQFQTYRLSPNDYHIIARCRTLGGKDHFETTTLTVSNESKAFKSATTWIEATGSITVRTDGVWSGPCGKE